jgi:acetyltransferase-like isoleucine patch superfamily enzyme
MGLPKDISLYSALVKDFRNPYYRIELLHYFIRNVPGNFGIILRRKMLGKYFKRMGKNFTIMPGVKFSNINKISVGDNLGLGFNDFLQGGGGINFGNDVILGPDVKIWSVNHQIHTDKVYSESGYEYKEVQIGNNVWIGANAFVMPGAEIGDNCVISAGSIVGGKAYGDNSLIAGNPARKIGIANQFFSKPGN